MRLFIAEKPDLGRAIAEALGVTKKGHGFIQCGDDVVTWAFGHMLQLCEPDEYDAKYKKWVMADLPFHHIPWRKKPLLDKQEQLDLIDNFLKSAKLVVHAGDPDEEGQLLIDEILEYYDNTLPVKRVLINDNNINAVKKELARLRDNNEFKGMSEAAEARSVGDQLYGYNMTRAYTLAAINQGYDGTLSVGRVQTPILGLVVRRDRENRGHRKAYFYTIKGSFNNESIDFDAKYLVDKDDPVDDKNRLIDRDFAINITNNCIGKSGKILAAKTQKKEKSPPLPYNLLKLQIDCSRKYGYKPDFVKDVTQSLREKHKLITYNRSDCQYLSMEHHADAKNIFNSIIQTATIFSKLSNVVNFKLKSKAFNDSKISAHHGIIPTVTVANFSNLSEHEQNVYLLVARAFIAQFLANQEYDYTEIKVKVSNYVFGVASKVTTNQGWLNLYKNDLGNEETVEDDDIIDCDLRTIKTNDTVLCKNAIVEDKETKPQPLYTMPTLLGDLTRVAKYVKDEKLKALLLEKDKGKEGEHGGIGTSATRDAIIKTLFERNLLIQNGNSIIASKMAHDFYDCLPDQARYPDMTAIWHDQQKDIVAGTCTPIQFVNKLMEYISEEITRIKVEGLNIKIPHEKCPKCSKPLKKIQGEKGIFWGCIGYAEGCKTSFPDKNGKPDFEANKISAYKCKNCEKGLIKKTGKKPKTYFWVCSGYPDCKTTYLDRLGEPNYSHNTKSSGRLAKFKPMKVTNQNSSNTKGVN